MEASRFEHRNFFYFPRKAKYMPEAVTPGDHPLDTMVALSDIITTRRYARVYARVIAMDTPTVEEIAEGLDSSETTVYEDINHLRDIGILERVTDTQPHRYQVRQLTLTVQADDDAYHITPTLIVALARSHTNENLRLYLDRHGTAGLATAVEYARDYVRGRMNARVMAREQDIPVLEAETILQELREVILDVEPEIEDRPDSDDLDAAVDELAQE